MTVPGERALDWVRGSLAQGSDLALSIAPRIALFECGLLLAPGLEGQADDVRPADEGGRCRVADSDRVAERFLRACSWADVKTLIVEDDLTRRGDPRLANQQVAYVADDVLRWLDLQEHSARSAVELLRSGASGYPLNAYLSASTAQELGLIHGRALGLTQQRAIAEATVGVIVSVYDAEAFLGLISSQLDQVLTVA